VSTFADREVSRGKQQRAIAQNGSDRVSAAAARVIWDLW
jgi:hypothetical protein